MNARRRWAVARELRRRSVGLIFSLAAAVTLLAPAAHAGIEEHSPDPGPIELGITVDETIERLKSNAEHNEAADDGQSGRTPSMAGIGTTEALKQHAILKWELAKYGIVYLTRAEAESEGLAPATNPDQEAPHASNDDKSERRNTRPRSRQADDRRREGETGTTEGRLTSAEGNAAAGCAASGQTASPGASSLAMLLAGMALLSVRRVLRTLR